MTRVRKVISIGTTALLIVVVTLALTVIVETKLNNGKTSFLGNELMVVLSGSMSPEFDTGSIVAVKPVAFAEVHTGDIVTYRNEGGYNITHRVVSISNGKLITKGDANNIADLAPVAPEQVIGKVQFSLPFVGYLITYLQSKIGFFLLLAIPGCYLLITSLRKVMSLANKEA